MPFATTHILNTWRADTSIRFTPRGKLLRKVDDKVTAYAQSATPANFRELKSAYFMWQVSKEEKYLKKDGWRSSLRNLAENQFPVERLHNFLFPAEEDQEVDNFSTLLAKEAKRDCVRILYGSRAKFLYKDDLKEMAKKAKEDASQLAREKLAKDHQVQTQYNEMQRRASSEVHKIANSIADQVKVGNVMATAVSTGYRWMKDVAQAIIDFLKGIAKDFMLFVKECWSSIRSLLVSLIAEICIALIPGINAIVSAAKSVKEYTDAVKLAFNACSQRFKDSQTIMMANKTYQLRTALTTFANNQFLLAMAEAGKQLVKALDNSFSVVSGVMIPGNVNKILTLTAFYVQKIAVLAKEYYYTRKINRHLNQINKYQPYLDDALLKDPLVAAYLIVNSTDSTLFATVRDNPDMSVWLDYCSEHITEFDSLKERAQEYIESRKIRLTDLKVKSGEVGPAPFLQQIQTFDKSMLSKVELSKPKSLLDEVKGFDKSSLKSVSTVEKRGHGLLDDIELYDKGKLKSVTTQEKHGYGLLDEITGFKKASLASTETQVKHGVSVLDEVELFNKKSLTPASTTVKRGVSVLDEVELFNKKALKQQSTKTLDYIAELKKLEMQLNSVNFQLMNKTLLGKASLSSDLNTPESLPVTTAEWKKLTWVKFGRRHDITKSIDTGIGKYHKYFTQHKSRLNKPSRCEQIPACLKLIAVRIELLQRDVLYPTKKWLDQLDSTHRTSPRRPAMTRLNASGQSERNALQKLAMELEQLHRRYGVMAGYKS